MTEGERLVKVETQLDSVLKEMTSLTKSFSRLEEKLDKREENFVTKDVLEEKLKLVNEKYDGVQKGLTDFRTERQIEKNTNKQMLPAWTNNLLAIIAIVVSLYAILHK